nr:hypothetical protein [uncultured bacterium]
MPHPVSGSNMNHWFMILPERWSPYLHFWELNGIPHCWRRFSPRSMMWEMGILRPSFQKTSFRILSGRVLISVAQTFLLIYLIA